jgi:glycosyltransferase involved in cell wall biosynthesis
MPLPATREHKPRPLRILHFVTGGFSGATQVAIDLCLAAQENESTEVLLVLRRKRNTAPERLNALAAKGLHVKVVPGWSHAATIWALWRIAREWAPDILVAHGFSEHLWGRYAGLLARVPHLVHVEHNSRERYTRWRLLQARWLAWRTDQIVGVSEGVRQHLIELGFPPQRCIAIANGIDLKRFAQAQLRPWDERPQAIVMAARFSRQKDHATLIEALGLLAARGLHPKLYLAGLGKKSIQRKIQRQVQELNLGGQVEFLGQVANMPELLASQRFFVLSTHYEGMPLALLEAMAAGCACIGTDVVGVREVIQDRQNGLLVPEQDSSALAAALEQLLGDPEQAARLGASARQQAERDFDLAHTHAKYSELFKRLWQAVTPRGSTLA